MPKFDKMAVMAKMKEAPIVPVFYHSDEITAQKVLQACYDGGIRCFEFTNRGDFAHEVFAALVKYAAVHCPDLALGVGSVVEPATAALYMQMGACFVVGPLFNAEVARICNRRQVPYIPGCGTISEVNAAQEAGCEICKVFPGDVLGPKFVKGLMAPMPWSRLMVTGGVEPTADNLHQWFGAGAFAVGIGSKLFPKDKILSGDWAYISALCHQSLQASKQQ